MRHLVAILICIALLLVMVGLFGVIIGGTYGDFVIGKPFDPTTLTGMFSPMRVRILLIALTVAFLFAVLDIKALVSKKRGPNDYGPLPNGHPLGFAAVRARRYFLPVMLMLYIGLIARFLIEPKYTEQYFAPYSGYVFAFFFLVARRGLEDSLFSVFDALMSLTGRGVDGFVGQKTSQ